LLGFAEGDHPQVVEAPGYNLEALSGLKISLGEAFHRLAQSVYGWADLITDYWILLTDPRL
jgi:hypothetical protein